VAVSSRHEGDDSPTMIYFAVASTAVPAVLLLSFVFLLYQSGSGFSQGALETETAAIVFILISSALTFMLVRRSSNRTELFQRKLLSANEALRVFMLSSPIPMKSISSGGTIKIWNTAAEKVFGWKGEEIIGRRHKDVLAFAQTRFADLAQLMQGGTPVSSKGLQIKRKAASLHRRA